MKKSIIKCGLLSLLFLGSISSFFYLNSPAVRNRLQNPIEKPVPQAGADEEKGELVLPDVTVIQKAIDLVKMLMSK